MSSFSHLGKEKHGQIGKIDLRTGFSFLFKSQKHIMAFTMPLLCNIAAMHERKDRKNN